MRLSFMPTLVTHRFAARLIVVACSTGLVSCAQQGQQSAASGADGNPTVATATPAKKPEAPASRDVTIPAGTPLTLSLVTAVASDNSSTEEEILARVAEPVTIDGLTAVPRGATVAGVVTSVRRSGRVKGRASLALTFDRLRTSHASYSMDAAPISRTAAATKGQDAKKIGIGAGAGALIGAVAGGGKGAVIGSIVGAGAGTGVTLATRGREVRLASGTRLTTKLRSPLTVQVPVDRQASN